MIQYHNQAVNTPVTLVTKISTTTVPTDLVLLLNGSANATAVTFTNINAAGVCSFVFTPTVTGIYTLYGDTQILATVEVVSRTLYSYLQNMEDEAIGSWQWDKVGGTLAMLRQDGTSLASFNVTDTLTAASRERI